MTKEERCRKFLEKNGWVLEGGEKAIDDPLSFHKTRCVTVDICEDEIVLIGETGDFCHLPIDYFALVGALFEFRQIGCNYIQVRTTGKNIKQCPLIGEECEKAEEQVGDLMCDGCQFIVK